MKLVGKLLARFRTEAGMTQVELALAAGVQEDTIASIEQGRRSLVPDLAETIDDLLDTKGALSTAVDNMPEYDLIPLWAEHYLNMEHEALALSWYDNQVIPGLLQTKAYAEAVFSMFLRGTPAPLGAREESHPGLGGAARRRIAP
ncbi:Scr1 family TA system antitoxin-like transcriptional regulator [Streptomyces sp. CNS654]|uniref:Scr1 family TA system antitoxin-like transcriptional regulator n=1 Tax=Streptomyces sp. CNS654 TaxID=1506995 RepID=UPI000B2007E5|nr:Scr1 family TA system antitoxin-like transcriptional regulator [Streptomyces sp. CNS654]